MPGAGGSVCSPDEKNTGAGGSVGSPVEKDAGAGGSVCSPGEKDTGAAAASVKKTVKMSETPDFIPYGDEDHASGGAGTFTRALGITLVPDRNLSF